MSSASAEAAPVLDEADAILDRVLDGEAEAEDVLDQLLADATAEASADGPSGAATKQAATTAAAVPASKKPGLQEVGDETAKRGGAQVAHHDDDLVAACLDELAGDDSLLDECLDAAGDASPPVEPPRPPPAQHRHARTRDERMSASSDEEAKPLVFPMFMRQPRPTADAARSDSLYRMATEMLTLGHHQDALEALCAAHRVADFRDDIEARARINTAIADLYKRCDRYAEFERDVVRWL